MTTDPTRPTPTIARKRPSRVRLGLIRRNLADGFYSDEEVISELLAEIAHLTQNKEAENGR